MCKISVVGKFGAQLHFWYYQLACISGVSRIFERGVPTHEGLLFGKIFAQSCIKIREIGPRGRFPTVNPPWIRHCVLMTYQD